MARSGVPVQDNEDTFLVSLCRATISIEWVLLLLMLPLVLFPSPASSPILLILPLLWVARKAPHGHFVPSTPLDWPLLLLLLMVFVSLFVTPDPHASLAKIVGMVYGISLYYAAVSGASRSARYLWLGIGLLLICGLGVVLLSLTATRWNVKLPVFLPIIARLPAPILAVPGAQRGLINTNEIAGVLSWVVPTALSLTCLALVKFRSFLRRPSKPFLLAFLFFSSLVLTGAFLLAQSRGALLGLLLAVVFMLVVAAGGNRRWLLALMLGSGLLVAGILLGDGRGATARLVLDASDVAVNEETMQSIEGRLEIWSRAIYGIQDFPFTGMGMNMFRRVVHVLYPMFLIPPTQDIAHAHNHFLQTALDLGIPGLIAYLAILLASAGMLRQVWIKTGDAWYRALVLGMSGSLIAYFVYGLTDVVALGARPGFIFWLLLGLLAGLHDLVVVRERDRLQVPVTSRVAEGREGNGS